VKINSNMGTNFEQQDFQKSPAGETPQTLPGDQLENFEATNNLLNAGANNQFTTDASLAGPLVLGDRSESFGINFTPLSAPAPEAPAEESNPIVDWLGDGLDYLKNFNVVDAGEWLLDKTVDGFLAAGDGLAQGILYTWDGIKAAGEGVGWVGEKIGEGAEWVGEQVWDGVSGWAGDTWDGMKFGGEQIADAAEEVGGAIADAAGAVGDAIGDALDW
jgi:hypothetical protein